MQLKIEDGRLILEAQTPAEAFQIAALVHGGSADEYLVGAVCDVNGKCFLEGVLKQKPGPRAKKAQPELPMPEERPITDDL